MELPTRDEMAMVIMKEWCTCQGMEGVPDTKWAVMAAKAIDERIQGYKKENDQILQKILSELKTVNTNLSSIKFGE